MNIQPSPPENIPETSLLEAQIISHSTVSLNSPLEDNPRERVRSAKQLDGIAFENLSNQPTVLLKTTAAHEDISLSSNSGHHDTSKLGKTVLKSKNKYGDTSVKSTPEIKITFHSEKEREDIAVRSALQFETTTWKSALENENATLQSISEHENTTPKHTLQVAKVKLKVTSQYELPTLKSVSEREYSSLKSLSDQDDVLKSLREFQNTAELESVTDSDTGRSYKDYDIISWKSISEQASTTLSAHSLPADLSLHEEAIEIKSSVSMPHVSSCPLEDYSLQQIDSDVIEHKEVEEPGISLQEQPAVIEADSPAPESAEASPLLPSNEGEDTNSINEEQLTGNDSEDILSKLKTDLEDNRDSQTQDKSNNNQQVNLGNENNNQLDDNEPDETSITIQQATVEAVSSLTQPAVDVPPLPKVQFDTEPQPPTQASIQSSNQRRKSSLQKKERKSVERPRQQKPKEAEMEEVAVKEGPQEEVKESEPVPETPPPPPEVPLDITVPDLPRQESERTKRHRDLRAKKTRRESLKFSVLDNANVHQDILEDMKEQGQFYDFSTMTEAAKEEYRKQRIKPLSWMQARLAFSQQSSRFELPIDMKLLETMSGVDYLKKYCIISHRRRALYQKIHAKYRGTQTSIDVQDLKRALQDVLFNTVTTSEIQDMCDIVGIERNAEIDFKLFAGIAAMAERMLYPKFLTDDTSEMKEYKKEMVELADFSALNWKLHNVKVNPEVRTIFRTLCC